MRWLKVTLAYDGTDYCGWQVQATRRSVQGTLEGAWTRVTGETTRWIASGRTDAGVHALGQVASLPTRSALPAETLQRALNASLPTDVRVREVAEAPSGFHAIRDARGKRYRYWLQDGGVPDVFCRRYAWFLPGALDLAAMRKGASYLVGRHDFRAFQASGSTRKTTVRHVRQLSLERRSCQMAELLELQIEADGFLYNMARNLVGTLVEVGRGKQPPEWVSRVLLGGRREQGGATAPAHGLCLVAVEY
jgi:tRNA pseudouridine38-40 synthase